MIKPFFVLLLILPFIYLGFKSVDLAVYKRRRGDSYTVKEYPVFIIGCVLFAVAGIIIANVDMLLGFF